MQGILQLTNELAEFACPVILTTRKEHFDATFGNFQAQTEELTNKKGKEGAIVLELQLWGMNEVQAFLEQAVRIANVRHRPKVSAFREAVSTGEVAGVFQDLYRHPLFLQMMLDLVVEDELLASSRAQLIAEWVERKIARDLESGRALPGRVIDRNAFIASMCELMTRVAALMTEETDGRKILIEEISSSCVERIASDVFRDGSVDIAELVTASLLVPKSRRLTAEVKVGFFHRFFQEYFLAQAVLRGHTNDKGLPSVVEELIRELST